MIGKDIFPEAFGNFNHLVKFSFSYERQIFSKSNKQKENARSNWSYYF
jgi:hypothetical protein